MRSHLPTKLMSAALLFGLCSCSFTAAQPPPRKVPIQQNWELQPGNQVGQFEVVGSLGDISVDMKGNKIKAPFDGQVQPTDTGCLAFTSPEVPAYLFRLCSVKQPRYGLVKAGQTIGRADILQFAAMRRQPDGTWAIVEPAVDVLKRTVGD